jgi:hypothetical protein
MSSYWFPSHLQPEGTKRKKRRRGCDESGKEQSFEAKLLPHLEWEGTIQKEEHFWV